jgi:carbonic anhydrase
MRYLPELFENNRAWAESRRAQDPTFFDRLSGGQEPEYLWVGCADSRVPANEVVGLDPGELFVHRNIANLVRPDEPSALSVLQYAVDVLEIDHVIVCGHYGCGGVLAALGAPMEGPVERWIAPIRELRHAHQLELADLPDGPARWRRLCELNTVDQVRSICATKTVRDAWSRGRSVIVHGWMYDLETGLLDDLDVSTAGPTE